MYFSKISTHEVKKMEKVHHHWIEFSIIFLENLNGMHNVVK